MSAFATVEEYIARYGEVDDEDVVQECLADASAAMRAALDKAGIDYSNPAEDFQDTLMRVCRMVANRLVPKAGSGFMQGVTQMSTTAGSYSEQFTFSNTYGTPKLLLNELSLLGIGGSNGRMLHPKVGCKHDCWYKG